MRYVAGIVVVLVALCLLKEAWEVWPIADGEVRAITTLSTPEAYRLVKRRWFWRRDTLDLQGLTTLSDEAAKALAQHEGWLDLNGLTTLSDEAAKALAQHKGENLLLNGLTTLSDEATKALAQHKGGLGLTDLTMLSDEAAKALAQHIGWLSLNRLTTLSDEAAGALRANPHIQLPDKFKK